MYGGTKSVGAMAVAVSLSTLATHAVAGTVSAEVTVGLYHAYGDFGGGDVAFYFNPTNALQGCDGAWIAPTQPGSKNMIATMMAAKLTNGTVRLYLDNAAIWTGSGARFCRVDSMGLK